VCGLTIKSPFDANGQQRPEYLIDGDELEAWLIQELPSQSNELPRLRPRAPLRSRSPVPESAHLVTSLIRRCGRRGETENLSRQNVSADGAQLGLAKSNIRMDAP